MSSVARKHCREGQRNLDLKHDLLKNVLVESIPCTSSTMNDFSTRVADYGLIAPVIDDTILKLERSLGTQRAADVWAHACSRARCAPDGRHTIDELIAIGRNLSETPGIVGVYGSSLSIRARSFRQLSSKSNLK